MDSGYTHVLEYDGGEMVDVMSRYPDRNRFLSPLRLKNGETLWALTLWPLPEGMDYDDVCAAGLGPTEYLQAAGSADALMVDIRKPGGSQWGCEWVRYSWVTRTNGFAARCVHHVAPQHRDDQRRRGVRRRRGRRPVPRPISRLGISRRGMRCGRWRVTARTGRSSRLAISPATSGDLA